MNQCPACRRTMIDGIWRCTACGTSLVPRPTSALASTTNHPGGDARAWAGLGLDLMWSIGAAALVVLVVCLAADSCKGLVWLRSGAVFAGIMAALGMTWRHGGVRNDLISALLAVVVTLSAIYTTHWIVVDRGISVARQSLADVRVQAALAALRSDDNDAPTKVDKQLAIQVGQSFDRVLGEFSGKIVNQLMWHSGWGAICTLGGLTIAFFLTRERALR